MFRLKQREDISVNKYNNFSFTLFCHKPFCLVKTLFRFVAVMPIWRLATVQQKHPRGDIRPMQTDAWLLANNTQHCRARHVASVRMEPQRWYFPGPTIPNFSIVLWPAKHSATILCPFAWNYNNVGLVKTYAHEHSKYYWTRMHRYFRRQPTILAVSCSCCIRLHALRNKCQLVQTAPDIVGLMMLWLEASVCMGL